MLLPVKDLANLLVSLLTHSHERSVEVKHCQVAARMRPPSSQAYEATRTQVLSTVLASELTAEPSIVGEEEAFSAVRNTIKTTNKTTIEDREAVKHGLFGRIWCCHWKKVVVALSIDLQFFVSLRTFEFSHSFLSGLTLYRHG